MPVRIESIRALYDRPIVLGNACPYERDAPLFIANKEPTRHHLIPSRVYIYIYIEAKRKRMRIFRSYVRFSIEQLKFFQRIN